MAYRNEADEELDMEETNSLLKHEIWTLHDYNIISTIELKILNKRVNKKYKIKEV